MDARYSKQREVIANRTSEFHAHAIARRAALEHRTEQANRPLQPGVPLADDDPAFDKEKAILARIMSRSHDDVLLRYPIVGQSLPSIAELKQIAAQEKNAKQKNLSSASPQRFHPPGGAEHPLARGDVAGGSVKSRPTTTGEGAAGAPSVSFNETVHPELQSSFSISAAGMRKVRSEPAASFYRKPYREQLADEEAKNDAADLLGPRSPKRLTFDFGAGVELESTGGSTTGSPVESEARVYP